MGVASDVTQLIRSASEGDFERLFGDGVSNWWSFVSERIDLGADELMIRLELEDTEFGEWWIWLVYGVEEHGRTLKFEELLIPDYENDPDSARSIPQGREQVPYFVLS